MPLDAVFLTGLVRELAPTLTGARIDKVQQPAKDALLLSVYTRSGPRRLLISAGQGARLHYTGEKPENPQAPPMFCMLLRKHLTGARIDALRQPEWERVCVLELTGRDEMGVERRLSLVVELMGRAANVILCDAAGNIIDCLRRADFGEEAYRRLLPGMLYRAPQRPAKPCFFALDREERRRLLEGADPGGEPAAWLLDSFSGLAPLVARELAHRAGGWRRLGEAMDALAESVEHGELRPTLLRVDGRERDFSFMSISQYGPAAENVEYGSFSELLDSFYAGRDRAERLRRAAHDTVKAVRTLRDRTARKLAARREELRRSADREELRRRGDLITANLWRAEKGADTLECVDYYAEGCPTVKVRLDPRKSAQQNAAQAYKEYRKAESAERHLASLIDSGEKQLDYLESVLDALDRAEGERDVQEIRAELAAQGLIKAARGARERRAKPAGPLRFTSAGGFEILVGRNNAQNDELTTRVARRGDLWLHAQRDHGSHVIVRCAGATPDEVTIAEAASLAAYYSAGRGAGKIPVACTEARHVKKPAGALPGKVVYTDYRTLYAEGDAGLAARLREAPERP